MDNMRKNRNTMNDRYTRSQMMRNPQMGCDACGNTRVVDHCDDDHGRNRSQCDDDRGRNRNHCDDDRGRNRHQCDDDCSRNRDMLYGMPVGMGYVPWQSFECTYEPAQAFAVGTIFPELDKPFYGRRGMR